MCTLRDCVVPLEYLASDTREIIVITRIEVIPEDGGNSYSIEDGYGNFLADAENLGRACEIAKEIADANNLSEFTVKW